MVEWQFCKLYVASSTLAFGFSWQFLPLTIRTNQLVLITFVHRHCQEKQTSGVGGVGKNGGTVRESKRLHENVRDLTFELPGVEERGELK